MKKTNKLLLIKSNINWADEMNLGGFAIFTDIEWSRHLALVKKGLNDKDWDGRLGIGSNQELFFDNIKKYMKQLKVTELSSKEAKTLIDAFNLKINDGINSEEWRYSSFGVFTAFSSDTITDILHQTEKGRNWLKANGYKVYY